MIVGPRGDADESLNVNFLVAGAGSPLFVRHRRHGRRPAVQTRADITADALDRSTTTVPRRKYDAANVATDPSLFFRDDAVQRDDRDLLTSEL